MTLKSKVPPEARKISFPKAEAGNAPAPPVVEVAAKGLTAVVIVTEEVGSTKTAPPRPAPPPP